MGNFFAVAQQISDYPGAHDLRGSFVSGHLTGLAIIIGVAATFAYWRRAALGRYELSIYALGIAFFVLMLYFDYSPP